MDDRAAGARAPTFLAIARYGAKYIRKSKLYWFFVFAAWIPAFIWSTAIYTAEETGRVRLISLDHLAAMDPTEYRRFIGDQAMFFLQIQVFAVTFMAALAGGAAIAEDARRHAFELYFSRPISAATYLLGKWFFVASRLLLVLLYPLLAVFAVAFAFLPNCMESCWPVLLHAAGAAIFMSACYALVVLGVSASVRSTRYAVVFWFIIAFSTIVAALILVQITGEAGFEPVSFRFAIEHVASWMIGAQLPAVRAVDPSDRSVALSASVLLVWLAGAGFLLARRVRLAGGS